jgi:hypothetical protein
MAPVDGIAALAARAERTVLDPQAQSAAVEVRALDAGGNVLSSVEVSPTTSLGGGPASTNDAACTVEQRLPPPGKTQPDDVATARAQVIDMYRRVHDGSTPTKDRAPLLDDPNGYVDIQNQLEVEYGDAVRTAHLGTIDVVFTSAQRAAVSFTVVATTGTFPFFGEAVITDDGWKVTRQTWCREITLAGKQCP